MPDLTISSEIVALAGPTRAIYIAHIISRLQRDAKRGATYMRYADRLAAEDTGLSPDEIRHARRWWADIGILAYVSRGIPPVIEYDIRATLTNWAAWHAIQFGTSAESIRHQRRNVAAPAPQACGNSAATDDDDLIEREIAAQAQKSGWNPDAWDAEARAIKQRCALRPGIRDLSAYTRASLIAAAQAGPPPQPAAHTQRQQPRRGRSEKILRPQVEYTEAEREAARQRAAARIAERRARSSTGETP